MQDLFLELQCRISMLIGYLKVSSKSVEFYSTESSHRGSEYSIIVL